MKAEQACIDNPVYERKDEFQKQIHVSMKIQYLRKVASQVIMAKIDSLINASQENIQP